MNKNPSNDTDIRQDFIISTYQYLSGIRNALNMLLDHCEERQMFSKNARKALMKEYDEAMEIVNNPNSSEKDKQFYWRKAANLIPAKNNLNGDDFANELWESLMHIENIFDKYFPES